MHSNLTQTTPDPASSSVHKQTGPASQRSRPLAALALLAAALFAVGISAAALHLRPNAALALRWVGVALFIPYALRRRSLLVWTFVAMAVGAALGMDAPHFAAQTRFLADIFLRLIRMIVAPLIFGGLVTGIAGHGELRRPAFSAAQLTS